MILMGLLRLRTKVGVRSITWVETAYQGMRLGLVALGIFFDFHVLSRMTTEKAIRKNKTGLHVYESKA